MGEVDRGHARAVCERAPSCRSGRAQPPHRALRDGRRLPRSARSHPSRRSRKSSPARAGATSIRGRSPTARRPRRPDSDGSAATGCSSTKQHGSYFFIGTLLTSLENDIASTEVADRCGSCTRCVDACPTHAILPNRTVASEDCISYATIEHRGPLPEDMHLDGNVFGCDICQEVCPWNRAPLDPHPAFVPRDEYRATPVTDLLRFEQSDFSRLFAKSAIKRAKLEGMKRNVAAGPASARERRGENAHRDARRPHQIERAPDHRRDSTLRSRYSHTASASGWSAMIGASARVFGSAMTSRARRYQCIASSGLSRSSSRTP